MKKRDYIEILVDEFAGSHSYDVITFTSYKRIHPSFTGDAYRLANNTDYVEEIEEEVPIDWEDFTDFVLNRADSYFDLEEEYQEKEKEDILEEINIQKIYTSYLSDNDIQNEYAWRYC